ncbi:uncharacterized protein [Prorops nasuta]|uniref:uncharacterized protein n=1 Tax=Prorops nasuta TaxID=863751 RepID=UPI0034CD6419
MLDEAEDEKFQEEVTNLNKENEELQQKLYETRMATKNIKASQNYLKERKQFLENSLVTETSDEQKKIYDTEEKWKLANKELEDAITSLENFILNAKKENENLRNEKINLEKTLRTSNTNANIIQENEKKKLVAQIELIEKTLNEKKEENKASKEKLSINKKRHEENLVTVKATQKMLEEINSQIKNIREDLLVCNSEVHILKTAPVKTFSKGNSLFAEIDSHCEQLKLKKKTLEKKISMIKTINTDQQKHIDSLKHKINLMKIEKETCMIKETLIEMYKSMIDNEKLTNSYKNEVQKLYIKLQKEINKNYENLSMIYKNESCSYLNTLLDHKEKEITKLKLKLESDSMENLKYEETQFQATIQKYYWRCKADFLKTNILDMKNYVNFGSNEMVVLNLLHDLNETCCLLNDRTYSQKLD